MAGQAGEADPSSNTANHIIPPHLRGTQLHKGLAGRNTEPEVAVTPTLEELKPLPEMTPEEISLEYDRIVGEGGSFDLPREAFLALDPETQIKAIVHNSGYIA